MKGYKCGSRSTLTGGLSTLTGGLSLWWELRSTKIDSCRATVLRLHVGGHVPQQLLTAGQCERAWSAACIVPSALYRHIEYGHRDQDGWHPCQPIRSERRKPVWAASNQRVMAASEPCRSIRSGKDRLDLGRGMADQADKAAHRLAPG